MRGTMIDATVRRVVDGDTLYVEEFNKSIRILSLDTEESRASGGKPKTIWGEAASERASLLLPEGSSIRLEFQGQDAPSEVWNRYVDNFGRGLAWIHLKDGQDFQEIMIREGYSPYFSKYGYAEWPELHTRYEKAERDAQASNVGVWDQIKVNGSVMRNYALLGTWWDLRARLIQSYRETKRHRTDIRIYNTRKDYQELSELAHSEEFVTIFTELRGIRRTGGIHGLISIGSLERPFDLFLERMDRDQMQNVIQLLSNRYFSNDDEKSHRRGYAFVTGNLQSFRGNPQMRLNDSSQILDILPE